MRIAGQRQGVRDWTGKKVGFLHVVDYVDVRNKNSRWLCRCACGNELIVSAPDLLRGSKYKSCGCRKSATIAAYRTIHGGTPRGNHDPAYHCWVNMRSRCYNPKNNRYQLYGARGIRVCDRWLVGENGKHPFDCLMEDLGPRPSRSHTIDRLDVDKDYSPDNCRWATPKEQGRNKRNNRYYEWKGKRRAIIEICEMESAHYGRTLCRLNDGWTLVEALGVPLQGRRKEWSSLASI